MGKWHLIQNVPLLNEIYKEPPIIRVSIFVCFVFKWSQDLRPFAAHTYLKSMGVLPPPGSTNNVKILQLKIVKNNYHAHVV